MTAQFPSPDPHPGPAGTPGTQMPGQRPWTGRRLVRRSDDRMIAGVCSGVADYLGVDVTLVRLLTVVATVLGLGSLVIAYLAAWVLLPEA